jgi:CheY-like chemotaxis protein
MDLSTQPNPALRILLVEDDPMAAGFLKEILEELGYSVVVTDSPADADKLLMDGEFEMVVSDSQFPDDPGGDSFLLDNTDLIGGASRVLITGQDLDQIARRKELEKHGIPVLQKGDDRFWYELENLAQQKIEADSTKASPVLTKLLRHKPAEGKRIFLCHAQADKPAVRELYRRLQHDGFKPWLDEKDLVGGQKWREEIPRAVRAADFVLVCLTQQAVTKEGYVQKEIKFALDIADEKPEGAIFLIPIKLAECSIPQRLSEFHCINLFDENGYNNLLRALASASIKNPFPN